MSSFTGLLAKPLEVKFGIYIKSFEINDKNKTFHASFYWWIRYPKLKKYHGFSEKDIKDIEFVNGRLEQNEVTEEKYIAKTNEYYLTATSRGEFTYSPDYRDYPFDVQTLSIICENNVLGMDKIVLVADLDNMQKFSDHTKFIGLSGKINSLQSSEIVDKATLETSTYVYDTNFGDLSLEGKDMYSRIKYSIYMERIFMPYLVKILFPLIVILVLSYSVLYIPPDQLEVNASLIVTSLLAAIAFQITTTDDLPYVGYLTNMDKVFYLSYLLISSSMMQSIYRFNADNSKNIRSQEIGIKVAFVLRFLYPFVFVMGILLIRSKVI